ncbi:MAG: hypothetical protein AB8B49_09690 [Nitratireductor sp.]
MFKKIIPTSVCAAIVMSAVSIFTPANANAGNFSITINGSQGHVNLHRSHSKGHYSKPHRRHFKGCKPGKAVRKVSHFGVRNAHVKRVGKRLIVIEGRKRQHRVKVAFYKKSRNCEVAWVDRTPMFRTQQHHYHNKRHNRHNGR